MQAIDVVSFVNDRQPRDPIDNKSYEAVTVEQRGKRLAIRRR